jgi:hypothetical protein
MDDTESPLSLDDGATAWDKLNDNFRIVLDDQGCLHWPVAFFYPEYRQSDLISDFIEHDTFETHLDIMFPSSQSKPVVEWDVKNIYKAKHLEIYFEIASDQTRGDRSRLVSVKHSSTLLSSLADPRYLVRHGLPSFIILSSKSSFRDRFLDSYHCI